MSQPWYKTAFGTHYSLLYAHRDQEEARACLALLPKLAPLHTVARRPLLDLGCGDGRHLAWLQAQSEPVVGLDLSPQLLAHARGLSPGGWLVRGDMQHLPCRSGAFDSVLSLFTAFGYFGELQANAPVVAGVSRILTVGGHWFLDYFDCAKVRAELHGGVLLVRQRELGPLMVTEARSLRPDGRQVVKNVTLEARAGQEKPAAVLGVGPEGLRYQEQVAVFSLAEMDALAAAHQLRRVAMAGGYRGEKVGAGSRWLMVYHKDESHD